MAVYLANIALMTVFYLSKNSLKNVKDKEAFFCVIAMLQWIVLSGFRDVSVGADTEAYKIAFGAVRFKSWTLLYNNFVKILFYGAKGKDPGYPIISKVAQCVSHNYQVWLIIIAIIFTIPLARWIYKNSKNPYISFVIYSCLFYSFFAITGHRQTIATGVLVFACEPLVKKRKIVPFLILVLLMSTVHKSCLVYVLYYFLYNKKITDRYVVAVIAAMFAGFVFKNQMLNLLNDMSGYEYGVFEGAGTYTFSFFYIAVMIVAFWFKKNILTQNPEASHIYNGMMLGMVFLPLTFVNPSMMRVVQYFSVNVMLMVPEIIDLFDGKEKRIITALCVCMLTLILVKNHPYYKFFWQ